MIVELTPKQTKILAGITLYTNISLYYLTEYLKMSLADTEQGIDELLQLKYIQEIAGNRYHPILFEVSKEGREYLTFSAHSRTDFYSYIQELAQMEL